MTVRMGERGRFVRRVASTTLSRGEAEDVMRTIVAATSRAYPHPNPRVAAAIVSPDGDIAALGVHERPGEPHAEPLALDGREFPGHAMVVTLEPCSFTGRTPPCTDAVIASGIREVWVGATDPDSRVAGQGIAQLESAGISVHTDVLPDLVEASDPGYFHHRRTGRARVTLKLASTLDGQVAAQDGTSQWITSSDARADAHRLRSLHDAVMVGAGTVIADDPRLDVRLEGYAGPQPRPVLVVGGRELDASAQIFERDPLAYQANDGVDLAAMLGDLPTHGILSVLVEGGPTLATNLVAVGLVDEIVWYLGSSLAAGIGRPALPGVWETLEDRVLLNITDVAQVGPDLRVTASIRGTASIGEAR